MNTKNSGMNYKILVLGLMPMMLTGCNALYGYQPPAPIFGESQGTNPYGKSIVAPIQSIENRREVFVEPAFETKPLPVETESSFAVREEVIVKRVASPAVLALVSEADRRSKAGDLESAVVTIERALRIDARNPRLTYKLAKLRLQQSKPRLAEDLAKKAALLSANDRALKKQSWLLISEARRQQKNYYGAKEAKLKADQL